MNDDGAWREQLCQEPDCSYSDRPQHIHCPWGGMHIHIVSDQGETVETIPPGRAALLGVGERLGA